MSVTTVSAVQIKLSIIGDEGNPADSTGIGAVSYLYLIGKYEVTNAQYVEFLNAVDPTGTDIRDLYNDDPHPSHIASGIDFSLGAPDGSKYSPKANFADKPVNYVSWYDAARFVNWLHNGQGSGDTENGVYDMSLGLPGTATRQVGARFFLPTHDEWYKAAYYDPGPSGPGDDYWLFATRSDSDPTVATDNLFGDISNPGPNVANYKNGANWNGSIYGDMTTVGSAGPDSASHYGTFDQSGNVEEWVESGSFVNRDHVGGNFTDAAGQLQAGAVIPLTNAIGESAQTGFRVGANIVANILLADISADFTVDIADFTLWADDFGETGSGLDADISSDGQVDIGDFTIWGDNFGNTLGAVSTAGGFSAVPEPSAFALFAIAVVSVAVYCSRRRHAGQR